MIRICPLGLPPNVLESTAVFPHEGTVRLQGAEPLRNISGSAKERKEVYRYENSHNQGSIRTFILSFVMLVFTACSA